MAAQAALIADTIAGMKRAISGLQYSSDSDDSFDFPSNRGNKLKRKAQYVHEGQLDRPNGPKVYKRKIEHAGFERYIISRNPKRYDEDGDELEDDEIDEQADADAATRNPYYEIRLEEILAPLTSAADLPSHAALSVPYVSNVLSGMVQQAREMMHREKKTLWSVKHVLTKLRGDAVWIPCGYLNSEVDDVIFDTESIYNEIIGVRLQSDPADIVGQKSVIDHASLPAFTQNNSVIEGGAPTLIADTNGTSQHAVAQDSHIVSSQDSRGVGLEAVLDIAVDPLGEQANSPIPAGQEETAEPHGRTPSPIKPTVYDPTGSESLSVIHNQSVRSDHDRAPPATAIMSPAIPEQDLELAKTPREQPLQTRDQIELRDIDAAPASVVDVGNTLLDHDVLPTAEEEKEAGSFSGENGENVSQPVPHRMTTRAQAQAASENTMSSRTRSMSNASSGPSAIHPIYLIPPSAYPDRDIGLDSNEAEDIRRMVTLYVQKQEEVCRGAERLYAGLLQADRMRKTVFKWCKAEGHVGEMSDGEDWYDKEEWGLDEDLRKGHYEEEDDAATQGKKTRGRR